MVRRAALAFYQSKCFYRVVVSSMRRVFYTFGYLYTRFRRRAHRFKHREKCKKVAMCAFSIRFDASPTARPMYFAPRRNIPTLSRSFCLSVTETNDDRIGCIMGGGDTHDGHDTTGSNTP